MSNASSVRGCLAVLSLAFFLWGILRSFDDILVALFQASGGLSSTRSMQIHGSFFAAYLLLSLPAGVYLRRYGYRTALPRALLLMAAGAALCIPALELSSLSLYLVAIFVVALGIAALQTFANPCIALLGPPDQAESRLLIAQGFSSLGSVTGPVAGLFLFGKWSHKEALAFPGHVLALIYTALTGSLLAVAILFYRCFGDQLMDARIHDAPMTWGLLRLRRSLFGCAAVFLYVGAEVTVLGNAIPLLSRHYREGVLPATAAALLAVYWGTVFCGRILAARFLTKVGSLLLLRSACGLALLLIWLALAVPGLPGGLCLLSVGLCNATVFPSIFALSVSGLRKDELPQASALLSTAICGGGVMPLLSGALADHFGVRSALILPCFAYALIGVFLGNLRSRRTLFLSATPTGTI